MSSVTYDGEIRTEEYTGIRCNGESIPVTPETDLVSIANEFKRKYGREADIELFKED